MTVPDHISEQAAKRLHRPKYLHMGHWLLVLPLSASNREKKLLQLQVERPCQEAHWSQTTMRQAPTDTIEGCDKSAWRAG